MEKRSILLAEDNSDDIELIRRVFARNHLANELAVVMDGKAALDYLWGRGLYEDRDAFFQPVLVLLDARLPKLDGLEVLQRLRAQPETSNLPVIMLSDDAEEKKAVKGAGLEVGAFLKKPFRFSRFIKAARKVGLNWMLLEGKGYPRKGV